MTRVSIGVPAYNRAALLDETLESLLAQDWPDLEIIVVDDGSTDDTPRVLERWSRRTPCIRVHRQRNGGEAAACNAAWERATGTLFGVVNSDDPQPPRLVQRTVAHLARHPEALVSYPDWSLLDERGRVVRQVEVPEYSRLRLFALTQCFLGPGAFIRRDRVIARLPQLRDTRFRFESEYYSYLVLSEFGPFVRIPEPLAAWRGHPEGASAVYPLEIAEEVVLIFRRYFERDSLPPDIVPLRSLALARARLTAAQMVMAKNPLLSARYCLATAHRLAPADLVHTVAHIAAVALYRASGLAARRDARASA